MIIDSNTRNKRIFNCYYLKQSRDDVVLRDIMEVSGGEVIKIVIESANPNHLHGIFLEIDKELKINNILYSSVELWIERSPNEVECICYTTDGFLSIYNIWQDSNNDKKRAFDYTSGMLIEELPNGRRYRCHDFGSEPNFNDLVFRIEKSMPAKKPQKFTQKPKQKFKSSISKKLKNMGLGSKRIISNYYQEKGRDDVIAWDILEVSDGEVIKLVFEFAKPNRLHGVWLTTDKGLTINNELCPSADIWENHAPEEVICICHTKDGFLSIYNIWMNLDGSGRGSQAGTSGMLIEELHNGRRYRCYDFGLEPDFNDLVFRIERIGFINK